MWARLWSRMTGGSMIGSRDLTGGGIDWRGVKKKMKNFLNKINGDSLSVRHPDRTDHINYSIDSGIESESSSLCLDHGEKDTMRKDENYGHDIIDKDDKNSMIVSTYTRKFSQNDPTKGQTISLSDPIGDTDFLRAFRPHISS